MSVCFECGQEYRVVYRNGEFLPLNVSDDRNHRKTCPSFTSRKARSRFKAKVERKSQARRDRAREKRRAYAERKAKRTYSAERANQEADNRLRAVLE